MEHKTFLQRAAQWLVIASFLGFGWAIAQSEPTMSEIYATAQSGKLDQAQVMVQQVLVSHPNSAKAHFVRAELYARQNDLGRARESLATAEKLSPGLSFAKPEAVQALRTQLSARSLPQTSPVPAPVQAVASHTGSSSSSWGLPLLLAGGVIVGAYFLFRRRPTEVVAQQQPAYGGQNTLSGPQNFGMGNGAPMPAGYYPPQAAGTGLGGRIMGGVATGLAVGAGVMAAEAIGRNLMGNHSASAANVEPRNDYQPLNSNPDMGGDNFGVSDASSWDDGGGAVGGSDWDN